MATRRATFIYFCQVFGKPRSVLRDEFRFDLFKSRIHEYKAKHIKATFNASVGNLHLERRETGEGSEVNISCFCFILGNFLSSSAAYDRSWAFIFSPPLYLDTRKRPSWGKFLSLPSGWKSIGREIFSLQLIDFSQPFPSNTGNKLVYKQIMIDELLHPKKGT